MMQIIALLPQEVPVYLVGGAIRDALLGRQSYDLDFVTQGKALKIARKLADDLGGAYFALDPMRKVARVVIKPDTKQKGNVNRTLRVDISAYQGADLYHDLMGRDFTINAMALDVRNMTSLIDPSGGAQDLIKKHLRACTPDSFLDDPVRILRAVRFSVDLDLRIMQDTFHRMLEAVPRLTQISAERLRDELFRILVKSNAATSLRLLDKLGTLEYLLPEICRLKQVQQSPPHVMNAWEHTLEVLNRLEGILEALGIIYDPDKASNLAMGLVVLHLGRYRQQISEHLANAINPDRPHQGLLFLASLYHDVGKPTTQKTNASGKLQFIGHDQIGSQMVEKRGQALKLSKLEIKRLVTIVNHHMRPSLLSHPEEKPSRKAIYRFFRDTGAAGVDICILSLADILATYGPTLPVDRWTRHLEVVRSLLDAWWEKRDDDVSPTSIVNGNDLMKALDLQSGPLVGYLLESIREAQINNEVHDRQEAINLAHKLMQEDIKNKTG